MAFALTTTKRKFHKILDSISNASSASLVPQNDQNNASTPTLPTAIESAAKKPRISRPDSAYIPSTPNTTSRQASSGRISLRQLSPSTINKERKAPNFAPWDRGQFLERLATFRHVDKWMGKPETINEVQWAKRGWTCVGRERVGCVGGCGMEVVIKLEEDQDSGQAQQEGGEDTSEGKDEDWRRSAQEQLIDKYTEMIVTEHDGGCLWRRRGCDGKRNLSNCGIVNLANTIYTDTIQRLPLAQHNAALDSLRLRYESLVKMASDLPSNLSTPQSFDMNKISRIMSRILRRNPTMAYTDAPPPYFDTDSVNLETLTLALFGWQAEENHISGLATCTACFRRLGLWLFKCTSTSSDGSRHNSASMSRLDVIGEHRDYCPWINGISQNGSAALSGGTSSTQGLTGWETLLRILTNAQESMNESEKPQEPDLDGAASDVASVASSVTGPKEKASRDEQDKERWAKLKRLKQVFNVKKGKGKRAPVVSGLKAAG